MELIFRWNIKQQIYSPEDGCINQNGDKFYIKNT